MNLKKILPTLAAVVFVASPSVAQTSEQYRACVNQCYQHYLAGMSQCTFASNPTLCRSYTEIAFSECRQECIG